MDAAILRFVESQDALRDQLSAYKKEAADTQKRISDREEAVQKIHSEAREKVDAAISAAKSQFEAVATEAAATLRTQEAEYVSNAEGVIKALEEQQKKAGRVVALIGGAGMADGYNAYADSQTTAAFRWNLAAVVLGVAAVIYLAVTLWDLRVATEVPSPAVIVLKSAVSITGLSVAGYMAHRLQSSKASRKSEVPRYGSCRARPVYRRACGRAKANVGLRRWGFGVHSRCRRRGEAIAALTRDEEVDGRVI
ncbi:hypothetical protein [uncultured Leifsonia sp.]|uniref:hypothetical protein n=1 Tax=uncultured Leifsonia sp. TaxID=340359 RepID=UPI0025DEEC01|nr:hypothetical protein [uncultured Leifsonia sp.]